ncbi:hypothetical protein GDO81_018343 [Engystomops pustulosus]|uniref:Uncharacterized protein n=1 Tax=Engystomops pustulosus TaxID=76066 RepID=A0AAV7ADI4_ENGPU|nr:hypothetical protein GDO81_018343 [Engystomops pustulosus]
MILDQPSVISGAYKAVAPLPFFTLQLCLLRLMNPPQTHQKPPNKREHKGSLKCGICVSGYTQLCRCMIYQVNPFRLINWEILV